MRQDRRHGQGPVRHMHARSSHLRRHAFSMPMLPMPTRRAVAVERASFPRRARPTSSRTCADAFSCPCFHTHSRSRTRADAQSQLHAQTDGRALDRPMRARPTSSRTRANDGRAVDRSTTQTDGRAVDRPMRARQAVERARASVPSNEIPCPRTPAHRRTDERAPCTRLCPACLIAQLGRKSVTDTPRATRVHMPACTLAVQ